MAVFENLEKKVTIKREILQYDESGESGTDSSSSENALIQKNQEIVRDNTNIKPENVSGNDSPTKPNYLNSPDTSPHKRMSKKENKLKITLAKDRSSPIDQDGPANKIPEESFKKNLKEKTFHEDAADEGLLKKTI